MTLLDELERLAYSDRVDSVETIEEQIQWANEGLRKTAEAIRPMNRQGAPGGLLLLDADIPLIVLPDLHARKDFLWAALNLEYANGTVYDALVSGSVQLLCVGDGFHAERRAYNRWQSSFKEYKRRFRSHKNMDLEMAESLGLMQMVMLLQASFPDSFFFLKGNHENILNEEGRGNHPFGKFVYEGEMVRTWCEKFLGMNFLLQFAEYEHMLPFMAVGNHLIVSHAEPAEIYDPEDIINIDEFDAIKLGLTWTANGQSLPGTVERMLQDYSDHFMKGLNHWVGGHRTIREMYKLRASDRYIQIHNPERWILLYSDQKSEIDPDRDIMDIQELRSLPQ